MSTFRSNLRVKHSLLGSCKEGLEVKAFLHQRSTLSKQRFALNTFAFLQIHRKHTYALTPPPERVTGRDRTGCGPTRSEHLFRSRALTSVCRLLGFFFTSFIPAVFRSLQISDATREEGPAERRHGPRTRH